MKQSWVILLYFLGLSLAQPTITEITPLSDLLGDSWRFPLLSHDGEKIFYEGNADDKVALCFLELASSSSQCFHYPEDVRLGRYSAPVWSPDSNRVLFTESFFDILRDSDLWQLTVTGDYTNLTDDDADYNLPRDRNKPSKALIDYLPTFSPTGELYFFRSRPTTGINEVLGTPFSLELFKLTETDEAKRVSSLRPQFPVWAVYQPAPISPDGGRIAFIVAGPQYNEDPNTGVWVQDLATGQREQILKLSDLPETRPGEPQDIPFLPRRLEWVGNEAFVVSTETSTGASTTMFRNTFYIVLETKEVTPFENFSELDMSDLYKDNIAESPISKLPIAGFVTPDAKHYVYIGGVNNEYFLWSRSLPLEDELPQRLADLPKSGEVVNFPGSFSTPATVSADGRHALILGYLLTLE